MVVLDLQIMVAHPKTPPSIFERRVELSSAPQVVAVVAVVLAIHPNQLQSQHLLML